MLEREWTFTRLSSPQGDISNSLAKALPKSAQHFAPGTAKKEDWARDMPEKEKPFLGHSGAFHGKGK